ncbi:MULTISPECIES: Type 1 glutamine amidotransferase-like domain-containing protein [unclassified Fusibacter]|uniref:Type 1 glutamine amidotransferase-like domain-containing protein n=1 Tax=unclassified Fusibacter TaxID=2624464 RepID=UPI0010115063|nr:MULTISPECIES: Type 1 glutamine amidotransferase-like domain-containing protein [unclassified Fusibacter]MCK8061568.1 Type 1 glutamine amidotransferase-like domain-containing protein [Fusibacter sp. A2]NPE23704.1 type 1 glutamine amidotransferase-like domain-containing protein [Fusibacter sp. A1]RXV58731.1 hypothetical protein DWB64_18125 [Fusibacter sp. A1]
MGKIVAIGGIGDLDRFGEIEKHLIEMSRSAYVRILYLPTAGNDEEKNFRLAKASFEGRFDCVVEPLLLIKGNLSEKRIRESVLDADMIIIGGGSVMLLMEQLIRHDMGALFYEALEKKSILAGISAGAICFGLDYLVAEDHQVVEVVECLGLVDERICPHYDRESYAVKREVFETYLKEHGLKGLRINDYSAVVFGKEAWEKR